MSKILIVDDEADIVKLVSARLTKEGYSVISAVDGPEALDKARTEKPDLIILDIMLPKLDGFQVCRMLKFDSNYRKIPIILFSARVQDADVAEGADVGADAYIKKPFDAETLLAKVAELFKLNK